MLTNFLISQDRPKCHLHWTVDSKGPYSVIKIKTKYNLNPIFHKILIHRNNGLSLTIIVFATSQYYSLYFFSCIFVRFRLNHSNLLPPAPALHPPPLHVRWNWKILSSVISKSISIPLSSPNQETPDGSADDLWPNHFCNWDMMSKPKTCSFLKFHIYLFFAVLGLYCCTSFSLVAVSKDCSPVCGLFTVMDCLVTEHGF